MVDTLGEKLLSLRKEGIHLVVGIDGLGGAGKTTLAKELSKIFLSENIPVTTIHLDDYIVEKNKRYNTGYEEWYEYYYLQWDIERLKIELFNKLDDHCQKFILPFYDWERDCTIPKQINIPHHSIVLVEGVFLQRKEWKSFFDVMIFVDCPLGMRMQRVLERDKYLGDYEIRLNKYKKRYWVAEDYYLEEVNPLKNADFIFPCKS